ncbi:MAG: hypothetical protein M0017_01370 [Desulfobacteraceae bacterium]|nr:hypothetical protein [Desulfobacteraceae bacterium]
MNAAEIIEWLESECGVEVTLAPPGDLDVSGNEKALERALPLLRERKAEIVDLLTRKQLPEVVRWLKPCPVCGGLDFVERTAGGFFCSGCQPTPEENVKHRVRAPGEIIRALGYGCGKCGNRIYRQVSAGWLCEGCGMVFELIGGSRGPVPVH